MIVPDWFVKLLQLLGLKDTPEKAKAREIAKSEMKLREIRAKIDKNKDEISSFQIDLQQYENERKQLMTKYQAATDPVQKQVFSANYDTVDKKVKEISYEISLLVEQNEKWFAEEKALKLMLAVIKGPDADETEVTIAKTEDAVEQNKETAKQQVELDKLTRREEQDLSTSNIAQAIGAAQAAPAQEAAAPKSAIESAIAAEAEKKEAAQPEAVNQ